MTSPAPPATPRVYNAIYSAVQVYECMVRGIAVMRRRVDSYVNATQILKVAGIDKGRRTKILEKEILPGKHEIVQGGYGKYQGTWIPIERGREIANQFGVGPLLAPLFDYVPPQPNVPRGLTVPPAGVRPLYSPQGLAPPHFGSPQGLPFHPIPTPHLPSQGIPRGSPFLPPAFSPLSTPKSGVPRVPSLTGTPQLNAAFLYPGSPNPYSSPRPLAGPSSLKRPREDSVSFTKKDTSDVRTSSASTSKPKESSVSDPSKPPPSKKARTDASAPSSASHPVDSIKKITRSGSRTRQSPANGERTPLPFKTSRPRAILTSITQNIGSQSIMQLLQGTDGSGNPDIILDDQGHTALHLAVSLSRLGLINLLIKAGVDIRRANNVGETPLIRCVQSNTSYQAQSFPAIMKHLVGSIGSVDNVSRSVLHHIALVAGVKQRASTALYYMESLLEHTARIGDGARTLKSVLDLQDIHGDTALNIAARIGNLSLVRNLLDVGANPSIANKMGLRPSDAVIDGDVVEMSPIPSSRYHLPPEASSSTHKAKNAIAALSAMIQHLTADFEAEFNIKQEKLETTRALVRSATRELADLRQRMQKGRSRTHKWDNIQLKIRNLELALRDEEAFRWTSTPNSSLTNGNSPNQPAQIQSEETATYEPERIFSAVPFSNSVPSGDSREDLKELRKIKAWHLKMDVLLRARSDKLRERNAAKELQCKQIVSLCTGMPSDNLDGMLDALLAALESEGRDVPEIPRIAGFMQKVQAA